MVIETICRNFTGYVSLARLGSAVRTASMTTEAKINGKLKKFFGIKKKISRVFRRPSLVLMVTMF